MSKLEGDAIHVVQTMRKEDRNWSHYIHLIEEVRGVLLKLFTTLKGLSCQAAHE